MEDCEIGKPRILVIEDNPGFAELVCVLARKAIPEVDCIHVPLLKDGLEILNSHPFKYFNAVVMDLNLPDTTLNSLFALHELYRIPHGASVIVLTGSEDYSDEARQYGVRTYLLKQKASDAVIQQVLREACIRGQ